VVGDWRGEDISQGRKRKGRERKGKEEWRVKGKEGRKEQKDRNGKKRKGNEEGFSVRLDISGIVFT
jgi:hypothetical protein